MSQGEVLVQEQPLRRLARAIVEGTGSDGEEAAIVADHLVDANLAGHDSHGVGMLPLYVRLAAAGLLRPGTAPTVVSDDGAILVLDGGRGYGQRVGREAMESAIDRCRDTGLGLTALRNSHHLGRIGTYGEQAMAAGLVSLHFVNVTDHPPLVAPYGGTDGRFSTNPVCLAMPGTANTEPILLDMATTKIAMGKVRVAKNLEVEVPDDCLIDAAGRPTNDPEVMFAEPRGALLPIGGYKGYGLAVFCDLLGGLLTGGGTNQPGNPPQGSVINHMLTFLVDPQRLVAEEWLHREIDALVEHLKASPRADAETPILVAGDPERLCRARRRRDGIPIDDNTWQELLEAAERVGLGRDVVAELAGA